MIAVEELTVKEIEFLIEALYAYKSTIEAGKAHKLIAEAFGKCFTINSKEEAIEASNWLDGQMDELQKQKTKLKEDAALLRAKLIKIRRSKQN